MLSLARARLLSGLTQRALADLVGVTEATILRIENGRQRPRPGTRLAIATALGRKIEDIKELANGDDGQAAAGNEG